MPVHLPRQNMNDNGCIHLNNFKAAKGTQPYKIVHAFFVSCTTAEARKYKVFFINLSFLDKNIFIIIILRIQISKMTVKHVA